MEPPDPLADAEASLEAMLAGATPPISAAQARAGLDAARADMMSGFAGRSLGFAVVYARPLYEGGDWQEFVAALIDGKRNAAIIARLSGSLIGALNARGEDVQAHLHERLHGAAGSLPNDGHRYENVILNHPRVYSA